MTKPAKQDFLTAFGANCQGGSAVEYALAAGILALALVVGVDRLGGEIARTYQSVISALDDEPDVAAESFDSLR